MNERMKLMMIKLIYYIDQNQHIIIQLVIKPVTIITLSTYTIYLINLLICS